MLTNEFESKAEIVIDDFINRAKSHKQDIHLLYLPTIFGTWQPDTFMFQNSILTDMNRGKPFRGLREETSDAIFVDDTYSKVGRAINGIYVLPFYVSMKKVLPIERRKPTKIK
jgi:hypothetical protein